MVSDATPVLAQEEETGDGVPGDDLEVPEELLGEVEAPETAGGEFEEEQEASWECQECDPARLHKDPGRPSPAQVEEHRDEWHIQYRSWCPHCVAGRATGEQHRCGKRADAKVPTFAFDYLLITRDGKVVTKQELREDTVITLKVLVAKDTHSKAVFAHTPCDTKARGRTATR